MYNGIVNIYKESGFTSHDVVAKMRGIYGQKKIGHTGTLDPMAEGVLIVCLGQATKLADLILTKDKEYLATMRLGQVTDTDDVTGQITQQAEESEVRELINASDFSEKFENILGEFLGQTMQVPPMYSAIKVNGKKLYEYARAGIEVERQPRPIEIYELETVGIDRERCEIAFRVRCSKGTYIRSLIRDIGEKLGVGATMSALLREEVNGLSSKDGYRLDDLQSLKSEDRLAETVLPMDKILSKVPGADIEDSSLKLLTNGNRIGVTGLVPIDTDIDTLKKADFIRVYFKGEIKALYSYDAEKKDFKVFKML